MKKLIGDKKFYGMVLMVAIPIMIQNGITNFVGLLDNIMVGQVGTNQMSGVAIINQMMLVFNISIFGAVSGAGIFGAQFYGSGDHEGVRYALRYKLIVCLLILMLGIGLFVFCDDLLINLYLNDADNAKDCLETLHYAKSYLRIMLLGLPPFAIEMAYSSTLREGGETVLPMKAGIVAVFVNLVINYLLIFGKFGFPEMGVDGAAIGTVISRFAQMAIVIGWTHVHHGKKMLQGLYSKFYIPFDLIKKITIKATPLLLNEAMWSLGVATMMQCYSVRGLDVVGGMNISNTIGNVFNVCFIAMGSAISIILGQRLGAGKLEEAKDYAGKLMFFSTAICVAVGAVMFLCAPLFPQIYNTSDAVRVLAERFIQVAAITMPLCAFTNASYFVLRSGGKTGITFLFDSAFMWVIVIPVAYCLSRFTALPIVPLYFTCVMMDLIKCIIGAILVKKGVWVENITK